jgi:hypothetical protein
MQTALSIPRFKSIGFDPAATFFNPAVTNACANTVAVVVPSPAMSAVLMQLLLPFVHLNFQLDL